MMRVDLVLFSASLNLLAAMIVFIGYAATHLSSEGPLTLVIWLWVNLAGVLYVLAWDRNVKRGAR